MSLIYHECSNLMRAATIDRENHYNKCVLCFIIYKGKREKKCTV